VVLEERIEARLPIHKEEADALEYVNNHYPEKGSRFSCAITIEPWMNEMPVRIGYSEFKETTDNGVDPLNDNRAWFYKI
jgi:hypothetical protein